MVLALLLCVVGLLSVSGGSQATLMLEAEPGDNVTLHCHSNLIDGSSYIHWFKQIKTSAPEFLLFMLYSAHVSKRPHDFERIMVFVNNSTTVSLIIREVRSADSGLYYCGIQKSYGQITFSSATLLQVKDEEAHEADERHEAEEAEEVEEAEEGEGSSFNIFFILTVIFVVATVVLSALLILLKARK
ncbi:hypothetical protein SRHO_G00258640 [Serrasalmus rhombeus]